MYTDTPAIADTRRPHSGRLSHEAILHQSDDRLVALARSGSERAWAEITRRYGRQLRAYCARFVGASRAEDAVQQTFLQAFLALRDGTQREIALRAWLYRIAHNCAIDVLRKSAPDCDQLDLEYDGVAQPPTLFEQREEVRRLVARMRDLPDAQRQALALRELEGRSYEEISAQLGHSGSGVRQLIFRARTALRNSAAGILPLGFLRSRLYQPGTLECHHVATAVSVPASSGGGIDAVSAATLAVVAVLGGGFAATDGSSRRARPVQAQPAGASPSPLTSPAVMAPGESPQARTGSAVAVRAPGARRGAPAAALSAPAAPGPLAPPGVPGAVAPGVLAPAPDAPAGTTSPPPSADGTTTAAPSAGAPASAFSGSMTAGAQPATGTTGPSGSTPAANTPPKPAAPQETKPAEAPAPKAQPVKSPAPKAAAPKAAAPKAAGPKAAPLKTQAPARPSERR